MGSLVRRITSAAQAGYGINILEVSPPASVQGISSNIAGIVAFLPCGPVNEVTEISSPTEFFSVFAPTDFTHDETTFTALYAFMNKSFPGGMKIVRIATGTQATAARTFDDASAGDSVTATANYPGAYGNQIYVAWSVNADDATARDATVTVGTTYSKLHENVATIVSSALVVTDPGDPYVTFSKASGATLVPAAIAATALTGGVDGTPTAANYLGSSSVDVGLRLFYGDSVEVNVVFVAEPAEGLIDDINTGLVTFADETKKAMVVLNTVEGQDYADAKEYVADYRQNDGYAVYPWPKVYTVNQYDDDRNEILVNTNAFIASALVSIDPEVSVGGKLGSQALYGITDLEVTSTTKAQNDALKAKGVLAMFMSTARGGAITWGDPNTSLESGKGKIFRRRMTDYITISISNLLELYVGETLDVNLAAGTLGPTTTAEIAAIAGFLDGLVSTGRIADYSIDGLSGNLQSNLDDGEWIILLQVKLNAHQEVIILKAEVGETVTITE